MLEALKREVCRANLELVREGLVLHTWGNVSGIDRQKGLVVIKPSGVAYDIMKPSHMVVVALATGKVVEGKLKPSSDTPTHLELYRAFAEVGGVVHTHSLYATAWAQAGKDLPAFGTTHADYFHGPVPCTRPLQAREIQSEYEANTGRVIVETFARGRALSSECARPRAQQAAKRPGRPDMPTAPDSRVSLRPGAGALQPLSCPGVLVASHGPFAWGASVPDAVHHAVVLEHLARLAAETLRLSPSAKPMNRVLLDKHFLRKHGSGAYYGQAPALRPVTKHRKRN